MKIVVATIGSRGDVQPYINLCQALGLAGHRAVLATNPTLCGLAEAHGVQAAPVGPAVDMGAEGARLMAQSFGNMWIGMIRVMKLGGRLVEEAYPDVLEVCRGADAIITSDTGSGMVEAEKLGIPWASVTLQPGRIPVPAANVSPAGRLLWSVLGRAFVAPANRFRRRVGAPPVKDIASMMSERLVLLPVSPNVAPPDPRWPAHVSQTGYWSARVDAGWRPPAALEDFLADGETPIAVSLGVMSASGRQALVGLKIVLEAVRRSGARAVLQGWDDLLADRPLPDGVFHAGSLPHSWLFGRVGAVVHHGGFGTTAEALRQGAPAVVVPHVIDQFYWGQRVRELGAGPAFIPRGKLNASNLAAAIREAREDGAMIERAAELGRRIRAEEDGLAAAVRVIEKTFG